MPDPATQSSAAEAATTRPREIAVIGGGAAGVLVASQLLRAGDGRLRPRVIEPRERLGEGIAYATRQPEHLLNVRAGNMAAFPDEPDGFTDFAARRTGAADSPAQRYLPRAWYADYLRDTLARFADPGSLHVRDAVVDIEGDGPFRVRLRSGQVLAADAVVIATGNA
ncbi:MAG TPA: FAD/NAD(P)-binding protein, partial [Luteimonas sp.]